MDEEILFITAEESGERVDALLARMIPELSRSSVQQLIEAGQILLGEQPLRKNYRCRAGDLLQVTLPELTELPLVPQNLPLDVVYEDEDLIVVNKARGMVVHPAPGHPDGTLVNALLFHCGNSLSGIGGEKRPGIVHRIDKDTSGLIIAAKNDFAHQKLSSQLSDHSLARTYEAVVRGRMKESSGTVDRPIGRHPTDRKRMAVTEKNARHAVTHWELIQNYLAYAHVRCRLETGRTHQIRVHLSSIGHPLLGDSMYGSPSPDKGLEGQCLHAKELRFVHPRNGVPVTLTTPLPDYFTAVLSRLGEPV